MQFFILLTISSLFLGSTIARILGNYLVYQKNINLFDSASFGDIPLFTKDIAYGKSFDILDFSFFIFLTLFVFGLFFIIYRKNKLLPKQELLIGLSHLIFSSLIYVSTFFAVYSGIITLIFIASWFFLTVLTLRYIPEELPSWTEGKKALSNGLITGFYLLILFHQLTTSIALPLAIFATTPIFFYLFCLRFKFLILPYYIFLVMAFAIPFNQVLLLILAIITISFLKLHKFVPSKFSDNLGKLYPITILFIFLYNPTFYIGSFDSIEEGFWAGWRQRSLNGQTIYRDFAAYHPPILLWGLSLFSKIFGESLHNLRLYFHLLQVIGLVILFFVLDKLVEKRWIKFSIFALILSYSSMLVRNNMEIRLASGLLPLLFIYWLGKNNRNTLLLFAGILSAVSLLISLETGIASLVALIITVMLSSSKKNILQNLLITFGGGMLVVIPMTGILLVSQSLSRFIEYLIYYPKIFSQGFHNAVIERSQLSTLVQWNEVSNFFGSAGFLWEMIKFSLVGSLCVAFLRKLKYKFREKEVLFVGISVFGIILTRSALGRSDYYHLVFVWIVSLLLLGYILEVISNYSKATSILVVVLLIFLFGRNQTQSLMQNQLIKFQTYGNPSGSYPSYQNSRAKILTGIDVNTKTTDEMTDYIKANVSDNEYIFVFPQAPEIYFLSDRMNATSFDTPIAFYTPFYQKQMILELEKNRPKLIIYNPKFALAGLTTENLNDVNQFIQKNYKTMEIFGDNHVLKPISPK